MSTSSLSSLLSSLASSSSTQSLAELLGENTSTSTTTTSSANAAIQDAVNAILNSATDTSGSGIDVTSTVDAILEADAAPEETLESQITTLDGQTSALDTLQSDLTSFQAAVETLTDYTGDFSALTVTSSDSDVVTATAVNGTATGTHTVEVSSLATTAADYTTDFSSDSAALPTGSFDLQVGSNTAVTIPVDSSDGTDTLSGLASYINDQDVGVTATVIDDSSGSRLALVSDTSGAAGQITISNDTTGTDGGGMGFTQATAGADASLTVDGIPVTSSSDTVTGVIPGVTLTLSGTSTTPVTLQLSPDLTTVADDINDFVTSWNTLIEAVNSDIQVGSTGTAGVLEGDSSVDFLQEELLSAIGTGMSGNDGIVNLQSIGLEMQDDGTLTVDSGTLGDALQTNFSAIQNLFQSTTSGVGQALTTALTNLTDPTTGPLAVDINGINSEISDLNSQISDFQLQLQNTQTQLTSEYDTINTTLEQLPETLAEINSQISALTDSSSSSS